MPLYKPPNSDNWYISVSHKGRRIRESTGTTDKKAAQEFHDKFKADLWREEKLGERHVTFGDACAHWLKAAVRSKNDRYGVRYLLSEISAGSSLRSIDSDLCDLFLADKSIQTKRRYIILVSAICRLSGHNPNIKRPVIKEGRIRWLTKMEWSRLEKSLKAVAPHLLPIAQFAISTGLRASNVLELEWSQCDLTRSTLWIHADQSKSGKTISVPLSSGALKVLKQQQGYDDRYVFPYYDTGKPITRVSNHGWYAAKKAAGLEDIVFHTLRHTWASWHIRGGTPLEVLQKLGGWASLDMVLKYAHLGESHIAEYANNAKPR